MAYHFGDVVLVPFPFTDQSASKQRPGVIVSNAAYHQARRDVVLMAITSQPQRCDGSAETSQGDAAQNSYTFMRPNAIVEPRAFRPVGSKHLLGADFDLHAVDAVDKLAKHCRYNTKSVSFNKLPWKNANFGDVCPNH